MQARIVPERVTRLREKHGWSQSELARRIGAKSQTIQQIEAGDVARPRSILALARELGTTAEWLYGEGPEDAPPEAYNDDGLDVEALTKVMEEVRAFYGETFPDIDARTEAEHVTRLYRRLLDRRRSAQ